MSFLETCSCVLLDHLSKKQPKEYKQYIDFWIDLMVANGYSLVEISNGLSMIMDALIVTKNPSESKDFLVSELSNILQNGVKK
jgi:hypothetical protein